MNCFLSVPIPLEPPLTSQRLGDTPKTPFVEVEENLLDFLCFYSCVLEFFALLSDVISSICHSERKFLQSKNWSRRISFFLLRLVRCFDSLRSLNMTMTTCFCCNIAILFHACHSEGENFEEIFESKNPVSLFVMKVHSKVSYYVILWCFAL